MNQRGLEFWRDSVSPDMKQNEILDLPLSHIWEIFLMFASRYIVALAMLKTKQKHKSVTIYIKIMKGWMRKTSAYLSIDFMKSNFEMRPFRDGHNRSDSIFTFDRLAVPSESLIIWIMLSKLNSSLSLHWINASYTVWADSATISLVSLSFLNNKLSSQPIISENCWSMLWNGVVLVSTSFYHRNWFKNDYECAQRWE